jgi:hypothetical protein
MATDYVSRLRLHVLGDPYTRFFTESKLHVATGYNRVVIGERGPYVEFELEHLVPLSLVEVAAEHYYYTELKTVRDSVKVYVQLHPVDYADYIPGKCYISPFELYDSMGRQLIVPLRDKP